jgi:hypothetical protein
MSLVAIARTVHKNDTWVRNSIERSIAARTLRLAGETDGWRMAQTERYAAMRSALSRIMVDPASEPKSIIEAVKALATLERDMSKLWGLQVQTGRDALAEAVADVVKARVQHGQRQRRERGQDAHAQQPDIEEKKTNRAGDKVDGHPSLPPQHPLKVLAPDLSEAEVIEAQLLDEAGEDLVYPEMPASKTEQPSSKRHRMVVTAKARAVLNGRLPTREPLGPSDLGVLKAVKKYRTIQEG